MTEEKLIRVAHVITRLCHGGAQLNTFHTVRLANPQRYRADLISGPTLGHEGSIEDRVRGAGVEIIREPALVREAAPLRDLIALRRLTRLFRQERYDIVHTHTSKAGFIGRLAARRAGVPVVVHTPHGNVFHGYFSRPVTKLFIAMERYAAKRTDRIITLTPGGIDEHLAQNIGCREQYITIFSGIDTQPYDEAIECRAQTRQSLGVGPQDFLVGGVGRLEEVKGFEYFLRAAAGIAKAAPHARFILAGHGSLEAKLRELAKPLGDRFAFLGSRDDVPKLMAAMDLCVVPSLNEGMGRVILEAGAAAVPVVATRVGGIPDIIEDGQTGILLPLRDPGAIVEAVTALANDPERRKGMGQAARAHVVPAYALKGMVGRIEELYEELLAERVVEGPRRTG